MGTGITYLVLILPIIYADSNRNTMRPSSPYHVPIVGTNIEVTNDTMDHESSYPQRPPHAQNMKRTIIATDQDEEGSEDEASVGEGGGRRDKVIKYVHGKSLSVVLD